MKNTATLERLSDREVVVRRLINGPLHLVYKAWTTPDLFKRWWVPRSCGATLLEYEAEVRTGGRYRLLFAFGDSKMEFFGKYLEVTPPSRLVWTNDEGDEPGAITTVTLETQGAQTLVVVHDLYPSKQALDEAIASGAPAGLPESLDQLEEVVVTLG